MICNSLFLRASIQTPCPLRRQSTGKSRSHSLRDPLESRLRGRELGETALISPKIRGVHGLAALLPGGTVLLVQQFVIDDEIDHVRRHLARIERRADHELVADRVVVTEFAAGDPPAPNQSWFGNGASEISIVDTLKRRVEIVKGPA